MKKSGVRKLAIVLAMGMTLTSAMPVQAGLFDWLKSSAEAKEEKTAYTFISNDTTILLDTEAAPVLKALGTPKQTFEQDSCAYQGKDKVYTYSGFQVGVYPVNGVDKISFVYLMDDTVSTPEGIKVGSTAEQVIEAYGKDYTELFGTYRYTLGNTELSIYMKDKVVDGIEYQIAPVK